MANKLKKFAFSAGLGAMTMIPTKSSAQIPTDDLTEIIPAEIIINDKKTIASLDSINLANYDGIIAQLTELRHRILVTQRVIILLNMYNPNTDTDNSKILRDYGKTLARIDSTIAWLCKSKLTYQLNTELYNKQRTK